MFDEPDDAPAEHAADTATRVREKADEFRIHAELAAVFEGVRKFDARLRPTLDADLARDVQRGMSRLDKARDDNNPILPEPSVAEAAALLGLADTHGLASGDYHIYRRPGETMVVRWLAGEEVALFYDRLQAHFDAALAGSRDEQREALAWKQDPKAEAYLAALDALDVSLADRFLRDPIREHRLFVLSTQAADEINIAFLCDFIMGVPAADLVGPVSAPPDEPTEQDLAWFFKLFLLRGVADGVERMCFFTYLQKTDDTFSE